MSFGGKGRIKVQSYYDHIDHIINSALNTDIGHTTLLSTTVTGLDDQVLSGFRRRYELIREYQQILLDLFVASLEGDEDPRIAQLVLNELPQQQGREYHLKLARNIFSRPVFFRTDEVTPGMISEIQCPGSLWGIPQLLCEFYAEHTDVFGEITNFQGSLAQQVAQALKSYVGSDPILHHLIDNSSYPSGERFFIQRLREQGVRYYGYDRNVTAYDCNFVRAHDFNSMFYENYAKFRREKAEQGELFYDLPPIALYEVKIAMIFPFWDKTRHHFSDEMRSMFPYTNLVTPKGVTLESGEQVSLEEFAALKRRERDYYFKYAGSDVALNWGSKGVYYGSSLSRASCEQLLQESTRDFATGRYWIMQKGYSEVQTASYFSRDGGVEECEAYSKYSAIYGPNGLMGVLLMQRPFRKVHGHVETIVSLCR
jgi:hypothetical protein